MRIEGRILERRKDKRRKDGLSQQGLSAKEAAESFLKKTEPSARRHVSISPEDAV